MFSNEILRNLFQPAIIFLVFCYVAQFKRTLMRSNTIRERHFPTIRRTLKYIGYSAKNFWILWNTYGILSNYILRKVMLWILRSNYLLKREKILYHSQPLLNMLSYIQICKYITFRVIIELQLFEIMVDCPLEQHTSQS